MNGTKKGYHGEKLLGEWLALLVNGSPLNNHSPAWLGRLQLDFYYPQHKLAFEFQGRQHFTDTALMERDERKAKLCKANGVLLIPILARHLHSRHIILKIRTGWRKHPGCKCACNCLNETRCMESEADLHKRSAEYRNSRKAYEDWTAWRMGSAGYKAAMAKQKTGAFVNFKKRRRVGV